MKHSKRWKKRKARDERRALKVKADVINIADRRRPADTITIRLPASARHTDELEAVALSEQFADWRAEAGDICLVYHTDDVRPGDAVNIQGRAEEYNYVGVLGEHDDYYYHLEEDSENEAESFHRTQARVVGRVVEVQRNRRTVKTAMPLRPIRHAGLERARRALHHALTAIQVYVERPVWRKGGQSR